MAEYQTAETWTVKRTAVYLGVSDRTVRRYLTDNKLSGYKVQGQRAKEWRIVAESAEALLQARETDKQDKVMAMSDRVMMDNALSLLSDLLAEVRALREELKQLPAAPQPRPWWRFWGRID